MYNAYVTCLFLHFQVQNEKTNYKSYRVIFFSALSSPGFWSRHSPKDLLSQIPNLWKNKKFKFSLARHESLQVE